MLMPVRNDGSGTERGKEGGNQNKSEKVVELEESFSFHV